MKKERLKILVVYKCLGYPLRTTSKEHLYSFEKYSNSYTYYLGLDTINAIPEYLLKIDFDLIIFHYGFVSARWTSRSFFEETVEQVLPLFKTRAVKVIMAQDEYKNSDDLDWFVNNYNIDCVFSISPESEWKKLYPNVNFDKVRFYRVLTGYLDEDSVERLTKMALEVNKDIDIGYRARNLPPWLGRHGYMKSTIAKVFIKRNEDYNFKIDISTRPEDVFFGDDWYKFMLRCKYFIGTEGGATVHDPRGEIWKCGEKYVKEHPNASFEEIEANCFPGLDGKLDNIVISPRHLEACATMTCQILVRSTFNGILVAGRHYIPLNEDYSNIDDVFKSLHDDATRKSIVENAYNDIVLSGKYSYRNSVKEIIFNSLGVDVCSSSYLSLPCLFPETLKLNRRIDQHQWWFQRMVEKKWFFYYWRYRGKVVLGSIILLKKLGAKSVYNLFRKKRMDKL